MTTSCRYGLRGAVCSLYVSPQPLHRQRMSLRAQITLPVATPTLHAAAIAAHRRDPAYDPVDNAAPHTVQGAVALWAYACVRGLASNVRADTVGSIERIPHSVCSMRMLRHQFTLCPVSLPIEDGYCAVSSAATLPPSFSHSSSAAFCCPRSMLKRSLTIRMVKTVAVASPTEGINGGLRRVWLVIRKVLSVKRQPTVTQMLHAAQRRAGNGCGPGEMRRLSVLVKLFKTLQYGCGNWAERVFLHGIEVVHNRSLTCCACGCCVGKSCRANTLFAKRVLQTLLDVVGSVVSRLRRTFFAVCLLTYIAGNRTVRGPRCSTTPSVSAPPHR